MMKLLSLSVFVLAIVVGLIIGSLINLGEANAWLYGGIVGALLGAVLVDFIRLWLTDSDGKKVVLDVLGPGKFLGELSMLSEGTRFNFSPWPCPLKRSFSPFLCW
jgi:hypothetical protein